MVGLVRHPGNEVHKIDCQVTTSSQSTIFQINQYLQTTNLSCLPEHERYILELESIFSDYHLE